MKKRESFGIALVRKRVGIPEILMIKKRYSYAFFDFVCGQYSQSTNALYKLFCKMTVDEKVDIMSGDFSKMWQRIWFNNRHTGAYPSYRERYVNIMTKNTKAINLLKKSTSSRLIWEIPKGRKYYRGESELDCAIREFKEETGISKDSYQLLQGKYKINQYCDNDIVWTTKHYLAVTDSKVDPHVIMSSGTMLAEVCDIKYMSIKEIEFLIDQRYLKYQIKPIIKFCKKYI